MVIVVDIISRHGLSIDTCYTNESNMSKLSTVQAINSQLNLTR